MPRDGMPMSGGFRAEESENVPAVLDSIPNTRRERVKKRGREREGRREEETRESLGVSEGRLRGRGEGVGRGRPGTEGSSRAAGPR